MPIQAIWDNPEHTILRYEFEHPWTWDEFYKAIDDEHAMLATVDHGVHVIFYSTTKRVQIPGNAVLHLRRMINTTHEKELQMVIVGGPMLLKSLLDTLNRVYKMAILERYAFVDTLDEAYAAIAQYQADHPA